MNQKMDKKEADCKSTVTVNILNNIKVSVGGKAVLAIILSILFFALVVSGVEPETLSNLVHSLIEVFTGS